MRRRRGRLAAGLAVLLAAELTLGGVILVSQPDPYAEYGYGLSQWDNFSAALDAAADSVTVTGGLDDLTFMLGFDGILLTARQPDPAADQLTAQEEANLVAYIATGKRVVLIGEGNSWSNWSAEILGVVGSTYAGEISGIANAIVAHQITAGAPRVAVFGGDGSPAMTLKAMALYDLDFATLWTTGAGTGTQQNALTVLTISAISDASWSAVNNGQFATNVAVWLAKGIIPEPTSLAILSLGVLAIWRCRRRRA